MQMTAFCLAIIVVYFVRRAELIREGEEFRKTLRGEGLKPWWGVG